MDRGKGVTQDEGVLHGGREVLSAYDDSYFCELIGRVTIAH